MACEGDILNLTIGPRAHFDQLLDSPKNSEELQAARARLAEASDFLKRTPNQLWSRAIAATLDQRLMTEREMLYLTAGLVLRRADTLESIYIEAGRSLSQHWDVDAVRELPRAIRNYLAKVGSLEEISAASTKAKALLQQSKLALVYFEDVDRKNPKINMLQDANLLLETLSNWSNPGKETVGLSPLLGTLRALANILAIRERGIRCVMADNEGACPQTAQSFPCDSPNRDLHLRQLPSGLTSRPDFNCQCWSLAFYKSIHESVMLVALEIDSWISDIDRLL